MVTSISVALHGALARRGRADEHAAHLPEHPEKPVVDGAEDAGHDE